jgi:hypothetical protein
MERHRWVTGDLHMHSVHSDGAYELGEVLRLSEAAGLEFVALTDHNTASQNRAYPYETPLICIPGMELTTYRGHINLLGVADPLGDFRVRTQDELGERLRDARQRGAKIGVNHPFRDCDTPGCRWEWGWDVDYDWVEIWNGPWRQCNSDALEWWQAQLERGKRVVAVGGSDTHRPRRHPYAPQHGMPTNWVWARAKFGEAILEAVAEGHLFLSHSQEGPTIDLRCGPFMMGDRVDEGSPKAEVRLEARRLSNGDVVRVVSDKGIEQEVVLADGDQQSEALTLAWPVEGRRFYRVEVWRYFEEAEGILMAAMSNPIYFG